ncbi:MAG: alpha/beta hydrolase [Lentisphaerae bacterium]|nr:alpha/beta hydrolase [Lentisphaerota bacterium]
MHTHIFKSIDGCDIRADVHPACGVSGPAPAIVWLHGGALMWGSCAYMTRPEQVELYTRAGYTFIAMDYRLAPESKLPDILADVTDGIRWVRDRGPRELGIRPDRLALIGHSAGGYLALLAGARVRPAVQAVVSLYGYGDIAAPWYTQPSPHALQHPRVTEAEARAVVGSRPLSQAGRERGTFYRWCRQNGVWPREVTGIDAAVSPHALSDFCPAALVDAHYPPTFLAHGDQDDDVPCALSAAMAAALQRGGIPHAYRTLTGFGHVFDDHFSHPAVIETFVDVLTFLATHLQD